MNKWIPLIICITGFVLYIAILVIFSIKISKAKKFVAPGATVPHSSKSFKTIFVTALLLELLPILVPLQTYIIAVVAGTGVLGEYLALKDRLDEIRKLRGDI